MKRSEINALIRKAIGFMEEQNFYLPPFAFWTPAQWAATGHAADEIRDCMLGWDLTDFGSGNLRKVGLILFTIRNGCPGNPAYRDKTYCEKIMIVEEDQVTPMHFHWKKTEDIINRGGGNLMIQLYNATADDQLDSGEVVASIDGIRRTMKAGETVTLKPGESICLTSRLYHTFWGEAGKGPVLVGEVSKVNDDASDNRFHEEIGRFPKIEEDTPPLHLLCWEYPKAKD